MQWQKIHKDLGFCYCAIRQWCAQECEFVRETDTSSFWTTKQDTPFFILGFLIIATMTLTIMKLQALSTRKADEKIYVSTAMHPARWLLNVQTPGNNW